MRKYIFLLFAFATLSFGATYTVSTIAQLEGNLSNVVDGDVILVSPGIYTVGSNLIVEKDITIRGLGATPNDVRFNSSGVGQAVFNLYTRDVIMENLSIRSSGHAIEVNQNTDYNLREPRDMKFLNLDIRTSAYNNSAIEIQDAANATILVKDSKLNASIDTIVAETVGTLTVMNSTVESRNGGSGYGGVITAAIHAINANQVNVLGGVIRGETNTMTVGTRAIEINKKVKSVTIDSACLYRGRYNVGIGYPGRKFITIKRTTFQQYGNAGVFYRRPATNINGTQNCLYGNNPINDGTASNRYKNKIWDGNYWTSVSARNEHDTAPLAFCPPTNNCIYEPRQYEYDFIHDECKQEAGDIYINRVESNNGVGAGGISEDDDGVVCRATRFQSPSSRIKVSDLSDTLNKTASMAFWIKTTQSGGTETWGSPGITGAEQAGTPNDIFWGWIHQDGRIGVSMGIDISARSTTPINDGNWHHVVLSREESTGRYQIFINGVRENNGVIMHNGNPLTLINSTVSYDEIGFIRAVNFLGQTNSADTIDRQFVGSLDELKIYKRVLTLSEVQTIYNNERVGKNHDGTPRECKSCSMFDAWDIFRDINDRNISTKIVQEDFNLSISALDPDTNTKIPYTGTLCYKIIDYANQDITSWQKSYYSLQSDKNISYSAPSGSKDARLLMKWKDNVNVPCPIATTDINRTNETNSTDNFAIRPKSFQITQPTAEQFSGQPYELEFFGKDALGGDTTNYDEQNTISFRANIDESTMAQCDATPTDYNASWSFVDGFHKEPITAYKEGSMGVTISDTSFTCNDRFAAVDCKDQNVTSFWDSSTDTPIGDANISIKWVCKNAFFDAWDTFRHTLTTPPNDRNISTKIVRKDFNITVASLDENKTSYKDFNGTMCARVEDSSTPLSAWEKMLFLEESSKVANFTIANANPSARVKLSWKKDMDLTCPISAAQEDNNSMSIDNFAIRPNSFNIQAPTSIKAGEDFNITFRGPDFTNVNSADYNETQGSSFEVMYKERNASCATGVFDVNLSSLWSFSDGAHRIETGYSEVGVVDINISDTSLTCNALYARVDCKDKNVTSHWNTDTDVPIGEANTTISFTPHHFEINSTLQNFNGRDFTYLARDVMSMYAPLDIKISAKNADGETTTNYSSICYAQDSNLTIGLNHTAITPNGRLSQIITHETNTSRDTNATLGSKEVSLNALSGTIFDDGKAHLTVRINFDRNNSLPVNPFDINISDINITDTNGVTETVESFDGNATFYYGRVRPIDILTSAKSSRTWAEMEIYSLNTSSYTANKLQNSLHWYRNNLHVNNSFGRLWNANDSEFGANPTPTNELGITFDTTDRGTQGINIVANDTSESFKRTIHFHTHTWLWHSTNAQNYNPATSCLEHPCLTYEYITSNVGTYIESGSFVGSDVNRTNMEVNTTQNRGIKVFR